MQVVIHACPQRMWYVEGYLVPTLREQGLEESEIEVWNDAHHWGCLISCMRCFASREGIPGGAWHLQDDVMLSRDFVRRAREHDEGVVCGYCNEEFGPDVTKTGTVRAADSWNSFPCIRIPNDLAAECARWFFHDARNRAEFAGWVNTGKRDDSFWHAFFEERHPDGPALNLVPNLADHVDFLVGGSVVNKWRGHNSRAYYWQDESLLEILKNRIKTGTR